MTQTMPSTTIEPTEDAIRLRSYLIWEREGRPEGKAAEHWAVARAELEAELQEASITGLSAELVLPRLPVSTPPLKSVSARVDERAGEQTGEED